jgi:hypothetical protein
MATNNLDVFKVVINEESALTEEIRKILLRDEFPVGISLIEPVED